MTSAAISPTPKKRVHWLVQTTYPLRAINCLIVFLAADAYIASPGRAPVVWFFLIFQFLIYPHILYLLARQARDQRRAEVTNMRLDAILLGVWAAALGFPQWVTLTAVIIPILPLATAIGMRGAVEAIALGTIGAAIMSGFFGHPIQGKPNWSSTLFCFVAILFQILTVTNGAYRLNIALRTARQKLRANELELKGANAALREHDVARTRFLAYAGHDLRQPLQALVLFISSLKKTDLDDRQRHLLTKTELSAVALGDLLNALLEISKLDAKTIRPEAAPLDVGTLLVELHQELEPQAQDKRLSLNLWLPREPLIVVADRNLLLTAIRNLIVNGIKYTLAGGILVSARRRSQNVVIQIWDTGIGIPEQEIPRIFDEFYQVNNQSRDRSKGIGLGLSIVRRISVLGNFDVTCRSRVGKGTVMELTLPVASVNNETIKVRTTGSDHVSLEGKAVVVVEDSGEVATAVTEWLEANGAIVHHYVSGEDALTDQATYGADYYLVDFRLSGELSGIEFVNVVQSRAGHKIRAAIFTGDTSPDFIAMATTSGWPILFKPIETHKLLEIFSVASKDI